MIKEIAGWLAECAAQRMSVILVKQHVKFALHLAGYAHVSDRGTVALQGAAGAVRDDPRLLRCLAP